MRRRLLALASLLLVPLAVFACAGDDPAAPGPKDHSKDPVVEGGAIPPSATDGGDAADGPLVVQRCTQADFDAPVGPNGGDFTADAGGMNVTITFPTDSTPAQYSNHCAKLKVGSTVTFSGSFENHPLIPKGGDSPTPIPSQSMNTDGGVLAIALSKAGTFGYECGFHASMYGAIQVVP